LPEYEADEDMRLILGSCCCLPLARSMGTLVLKVGGFRLKLWIRSMALEQGSRPMLVVYIGTDRRLIDIDILGWPWIGCAASLPP
jgi:hypothetical protein